MKLIILTLSLLFALSSAVEKDGKAKLQIGIKKRIENCTVKTKKGDLVHIHYTVSKI